MGDFIYIADGIWRHARPVVRVMPSEQWMNPAEAGQILAKDHLLNTTTGIWFYEGDMLYESAKLRERLLALADYVVTPEFDAAYQRPAPHRGRADYRVATGILTYMVALRSAVHGPSMVTTSPL